MISEATLNWIMQDHQSALIAIAAGTLIVLVLMGLRGLLLRLARGRRSHSAIVALLADLARKTKLWFMIAVAGQMVGRYFELPPQVAKTITFLFTVAATVQAAIWIRAFVIDLVEQRVSDGDGDYGNLHSALNIIRLLISVTVFAVAGILILDNLGVNVTGLVAGLGVGGIAIGLAAQGIFSDLFAALSIIFDRPFEVGDTITYQGKEGPITGTVEQIGLKSTRIRSLTGELRILANAKLLEQELTNYQGRSFYRLHLTVGVTYQTPADLADSIPDLMQAQVEQAGQKFIRATFTGFGDSSLNFEVYFNADVDNIVDAQKAYQKVALGIFRSFAEKGIEFAYPTQTNFTAAPDGTMIMPYHTPAAPAGG